MTSTLDTLAYSLDVKVAGASLPATVAANLISGEVESSMSHPDSVRLVFRDADNKVLEDGGFMIGHAIEASFEVDNSGWEVMSGEITGVELEASSTGRFVMVRGLDLSHRMLAGTKTKAFQQMTASDIVQDIVRESAPGLTTQIDETSSTYSVMTQANVSDWAFIQQLALLSNRQAFVSRGVFHFVKPMDTSAAPSAADLSQGLVPGQLVFQKNVLRLQGSVSGTEQVGSVEVRGWDCDNKTAVTASETAGTVSVRIDDTPTEIANLLGDRTLTYTGVPFPDTGEAQTLASSLSERVSASYAEIEGESLGTPELHAGFAVTLSEAGTPFDGKYVITSARHRVDHLGGGFRTWFRMGGGTDRSLLTLVAGCGGAGGANLPIPNISGVVTATVSSVKDPENKGRVQLKFPWLDDSYVSDWARTSEISADSGFGSSFVPEVNTEVLVAFDHGNPQYPFVIGGLYNGSDVAHQYGIPFVDAKTGAINYRAIRSRTGHTLLLSDEQGLRKVLLETGGQECSILLKAEPSPTTVTIDSKGNVEIKGAQDVSIEAGQDLTLKATGSLSMEAATASIKTSGEFQLESNGTAELKANGPMSVSGSMVKLGGG